LFLIFWFSIFLCHGIHFEEYEIFLAVHVRTIIYCTWCDFLLKYNPRHSRPLMDKSFEWLSWCWCRISYSIGASRMHLLRSCSSVVVQYDCLISLLLYLICCKINYSNLLLYLLTCCYIGIYNGLADCCGVPQLAKKLNQVEFLQHYLLSQYLEGHHFKV